MTSLNLLPLLSRMRPPHCPNLFAVAVFVSALAIGSACAEVKVLPEKDKIRVEIDGKPFTDFVLREGNAMKPYLYPLRSATGKIVTRHFPMETVPGEPKDHPHQRGLWFGHERVNGIDFWNNEDNYKSTNRGRIVAAKIAETRGGAEAGVIKLNLDWLDPQGAKLLEESREMVFHSHPELRIIDFDITLIASAKVTFGDAKDGTFGLRLATELEEDSPSGKGGDKKTAHTGTIIDAQGHEHEKAVWGKPSDWMDYSGTVEGEKVGVAIFDHPGNSPRARWHVRAYGLFAANPFGLGVFTGDKSQDGSVTLEPGKTLRLRYRVVIHPGNAKSAGIPALWESYLKEVK